MNDRLIITLITVSLLIPFSAGVIFSTRQISECNTAVVNIHGDIVNTEMSNQNPLDGYLTASSEEITQQLRELEEDPSIKGIIVSINSSGGSVVGSEEIANQIAKSQKPTVALIRETASSGGYWVASATDYIVASANSDVGSIGIIITVTDESSKNQQEGIRYETISSGKFKDSGLGIRPLNSAEKDLYQRDVDINFNNFIEAVSNFRDIPKEELLKIADGSTFPGVLALENSLIDEIGSLDEAQNYLSEIIGSSNICNAQ